MRRRHPHPVTAIDLCVEVGRSQAHGESSPLPAAITLESASQPFTGPALPRCSGNHSAYPPSWRANVAWPTAIHIRYPGNVRNRCPPNTDETAVKTQASDSSTYAGRFRVPAPDCAIRTRVPNVKNGPRQ